jgi:outer membrane receptor protein involved in Fe transport
VRPIDEHHAANVMSGGVEWEARPGRTVGLVAGYALSLRDDSEGLRRAPPILLAGLSKDWRTGLTLHAAAFRRVRFPSINDLYETGSGNPNLRPERSRGIESGIDYRAGRRHATINAFFMKTRDFIERDNDTTRYVNRDRYTVSGIDTSLTTAVTAHLDVRSMYSFLNAVDRSSGSERAQLQYQPRHRVSVDTRWSVTPSVGALLAVAWVGAEPYYSRSAPLVSGTTRPYTLCDLAVTKSVIRSRVTLTVGMTNAFDVYRESPYGMPQPGRTMYMALRAYTVH